MISIETSYIVRENHNTNIQTANVPVKLKLISQRSYFLLHRPRSQLHVHFLHEHRPMSEIKDDPLRERPKYPPDKRHFDPIVKLVDEPVVIADDIEGLAGRYLTRPVKVKPSKGKVKSVAVVQQRHLDERLLVLHAARSS